MRLLYNSLFYLQQYIVFKHTRPSRAIEKYFAPRDHVAKPWQSAPLLFLKLIFGGRKQSVLQETVLKVVTGLDYSIWCFKPLYVNSADTYTLFSSLNKMFIRYMYRQRLRLWRNGSVQIEVRHPLSNMCFATRKCKYNGDFLSLSIICCQKGLILRPTGTTKYEYCSNDEIGLAPGERVPLRVTLYFILSSIVVLLSVNS